MFWRKRNAELDKRLNTVIETTERTRKSMQLPPSRVIIDASYSGTVEQECEKLPDSGEPSADDDPVHFRQDSDQIISAFPIGDHEASVESDPGKVSQGPDETPDNPPAPAAGTSPGPALGGDPADFEAERAELLRRAEEAEQKLEAVYSAAEQQEVAARETHEALQREISARRMLEEARDALARRVDEIELASIQARALAETLEESARSATEAFEQEVIARRALEKERDSLVRRMEEAEAKLDARPAVAESDDRLRAANEAIERETAARLAAEASRDELSRKLETIESELQSLLASRAEQEERYRSLSDAMSREVEARQAADALRSEAQSRAEAAADALMQLRAQIAEQGVALRSAEAAAQRELTARLSVEAELENAISKAEAVQGELAAFRRAASESKSVASISTDHNAVDAGGDQKGMEEEQAEVPAILPKHPGAPSEMAMPEQIPVAKVAENLPAVRLAQETADRRVSHVSEAAADTAADRHVRDQGPIARLRAVSRSLRVDQPSEEVQAAEALPGAVTATSDGPANRRDRRVASQIPATLWREGMGQPLSCTLRDRSPSGARLEFKHASVIEGFSAFNVGDQATLTLNSAHEKTWVGCEIAWVDDNCCGVRFLGQFRSEGPASRKSTRTATHEKTQRPKAGSRLASVFSLRG